MSGLLPKRNRALSRVAKETFWLLLEWRDRLILLTATWVKVLGGLVTVLPLLFFGYRVAAPGLLSPKAEHILHAQWIVWFSVVVIAATVFICLTATRLWPSRWAFGRERRIRQQSVKRRLYARLGATMQSQGAVPAIPPEVDQIGCWGTWGLIHRRYHRPPFSLCLCKVRSNLALQFARAPLAKHPRNYCFYLVPSGLSGWLWRFAPVLACLMAVSFLEFVSWWWAVLFATILTILLPLGAFLLFHTLASPVLTGAWEGPRWTEKFDSLLFGLFPPKPKPDQHWRPSYPQEGLRDHVWRAVFNIFPSSRTPHATLGELAPQVALLQAGIMDMLRNDPCEPSPQWCSRPVIRWVIFWLFPSWMSFCVLVLWLLVLLLLAHISNASGLSGAGGGLSPLYSLFVGEPSGLTVLWHGNPPSVGSKAYLLLPEISFICGVIFWLVCSLVFMMRVGRYISTWLYFENVNRMGLLLPSIAKMVPDLKDNAKFLEEIATSRVIAIVAGVLSALLSAIMKVLL
ncbi:MAG: hypothetical protein AB9900_02540 [Humidesulfovibrio sp.]